MFMWNVERTWFIKLFDAWNVKFCDCFCNLPLFFRHFFFPSSSSSSCIPPEVYTSSSIWFNYFRLVVLSPSSYLHCKLTCSVSSSSLSSSPSFFLLAPILTRRCWFQFSEITRWLATIPASCWGNDAVRWWMLWSCLGRCLRGQRRQPIQRWIRRK